MPFKYGIKVGYFDSVENKAFPIANEGFVGFTPSFTVSDYLEKLTINGIKGLADLKNIYKYLNTSPGLSENYAIKETFNFKVNTTDRNAIILYGSRDDRYVLLYNIFITNYNYISEFFPSEAKAFSDLAIKFIEEFILSSQYAEFQSYIHDRNYISAMHIFETKFIEYFAEYLNNYGKGELTSSIVEFTQTSNYFFVASTFEYLLSHFYLLNNSLYFQIKEKNNHPPIFDYSRFSPINNITYTLSKVNLKWDAHDPENEEIFYSVYVGSNRDKLNLVASNLMENNFELSNNNSIKVYWKIVAMDKSGNISETPVMSFYYTNEEFLKNTFKKFEDLGFKVNYGNNPPDVNGTFKFSPNKFINSNSTKDNSQLNTDFADVIVDINVQNQIVNILRTRQVESYSNFVDYILIGSGNNFTIYTKGKYISTFEDCINVTTVIENIFSGVFENGEIKNFTNSFHMIDNGNCSNIVENGRIRVFRDNDFISEKTQWFIDPRLDVRNENIKSNFIK